MTEEQKFEELIIDRLCKALGVARNVVKKEYNTYVATARDQKLSFKGYLQKKNNAEVDKQCMEIGITREDLDKCFKLYVSKNDKGDITVLEWLKEVKSNGYNPINCVEPDLESSRGRK